MEYDFLILSFMPLSPEKGAPQEDYIGWAMNGRFFCDDADLQDRLNLLGKTGWHLAAVTGQGGRIFLQKMVVPYPTKCVQTPFLDDSLETEEETVGKDGDSDSGELSPLDQGNPTLAEIVGDIRRGLRS